MSIKIAKKRVFRVGSGNRGKIRAKSPRNKKYVRVKRKNHVGEVYRGVTKYIDRDEKPKRNYVVVEQDDKGVAVAKLKSIKKFDNEGKNADPYLVEINQQRYGLKKRTGVDKKKFRTNRIKYHPLTLDDKDVFPEGDPRFTLSRRDKDKVLNHTGVKRRNRRKKRR